MRFVHPRCRRRRFQPTRLLHQHPKPGFERATFFIIGQVHQRATFAESFRMTNAQAFAIFAAERRIPMQKSTIGKGALVFAAVLGILTALSVIAARTSPEEAKALAELKRMGCNAMATTFDAQLACARIQPEAAFITEKLKISGFFAITTLMSLGFGLAMLARPDADKPADMGSTEERARQRRLTLAAQEKLREEQSKRDGTS